MSSSELWFLLADGFHCGVSASSRPGHHHFILQLEQSVWSSNDTSLSLPAESEWPQISWKSPTGASEGLQLQQNDLRDNTPTNRMSLKWIWISMNLKEENAMNKMLNEFGKDRKIHAINTTNINQNGVRRRNTTKAAHFFFFWLVSLRRVFYTRTDSLDGGLIWLQRPGDRMTAAEVELMKKKLRKSF